MKHSRNQLTIGCSSAAKSAARTHYALLRVPLSRGVSALSRKVDTLRFSQVKKFVKTLPGLYEIYTLEGLPLKVGIAKDLRKRLTAHGNSKQGRLKLRTQELGYTLENVESKQSILAKHLCFDSTLTKKYDLKTEIGRVSFLENECFIKIQYTRTKNEAREIERKKELSGKYRYVGRVHQR